MVSCNLTLIKRTAKISKISNYVISLSTETKAKATSLSLINIHFPQKPNCTFPPLHLTSPSNLSTPLSLSLALSISFLPLLLHIYIYPSLLR